ncbi:MAG: lactate utilization protein, partial [Lachnospiraceae bacterium]|nr:lactate utilization protein [Lachnospiraceae bacterium]
MPKEKHTEIIVKSLIENLNKRHMEGQFFKTKDDLLAYLDTEIKSGEKIASGGSVTLKELGVIDHIKSRNDVNYLDRNNAK